MSDYIGENPPQKLDHSMPPFQLDAHIMSKTSDVPISARPQLRTRLRQLAIMIVIVIAALAVIIVTTGGNTAPPKPGSSQADTTVQAVSALLAGIPQSANTLGKPTAPVTLKWYGDLECPFCREFTLGALPTIIASWVRTNALKIEYLSMETATRELQIFQTQQIAALAAGMQDVMWNYVETFYHEQGEEDSGYVTEEYLDNIASQVPGLNLELWNEDRHSPELADQVMAERQAARRARYHGTPTFLIGLTNGRMHQFIPRSLANPEQYNEAIESLLRTNEEALLH